MLTVDDSSDYKPEGMGPDETIAQSAVPSVTYDNDVLSVYPNPAGRCVNVQIKDNIYADGILTIVDLQGRSVQVIAVSGNHPGVTDVSSLEPGVYFMKFEQNNQFVAVSRFFKN